MWIYTEHGFFSIMNDRNNSHRLMVRARRRAHIEWFRDELKEMKGDAIFPLNAVSEVIETESDYPYRIFAVKGLVGAMIVKLLVEMEYNSDFKGNVAKLLGPDVGRIYGQVWGVTAGLNDTGAWDL